jgi:AAA+ ATPase superfamily predicted ATPase
MTDMAPWSFYGRRSELQQMQRILERRRWFFLQISGRRRIGKTARIQEALRAAAIDRTLYIQIPDSDPAGVVAACNGYLETFGIDARVSSLGELAQLIGRLASAGYVVALDEFQYFHRKQLADFCSLLQAEVDRLAARAAEVVGGLIVLGSLHAEMTAVLEDRDAPLFNRSTDTIELGHLDIASVLEILRVHANDDPSRLLFLWNLFEGVPKFYRDAYEQGALNAERRPLLRSLFFSSSSPLRNEADNWFLRELRGRYDMVLQYLARHPGCTNADIEATMVELSGPGEVRQVGGYLKVLSERYRMIERRLPIFSPARARSGRYYIRDNFLRAWLSALQRPVSAVAFLAYRRPDRPGRWASNRRRGLRAGRPRGPAIRGAQPPGYWRLRAQRAHPWLLGSLRRRNRPRGGERRRTTNSLRHLQAQPRTSDWLGRCAEDGRRPLPCRASEVQRVDQRVCGHRPRHWRERQGGIAGARRIATEPRRPDGRTVTEAGKQTWNSASQIRSPTAWRA